MRVHLTRADKACTSQERNRVLRLGPAACGTRTTKRANVLRLPWVTGDPAEVTCRRCRSAPKRTAV